MLAVMRKKKATGFAGWVTYEVKDKESKWNKIMPSLRSTQMLAATAQVDSAWRVFLRKSCDEGAW